jgi:hypothetical protein
MAGISEDVLFNHRKAFDMAFFTLIMALFEANHTL